jgi:hypothetical protein
MKITTLAFSILVIVLALTLKLFTYEYYFEDDATTGIALRLNPSLENKLVLDESSVYILITDENSFLGEGLYRILVSWGWLVLLALGIVTMIASKRQRK